MSRSWYLDSAKSNSQALYIMSMHFFWYDTNLGRCLGATALQDWGKRRFTVTAWVLQRGIV